MQETIIETSTQRLRYWLDDNDLLHFTVLHGRLPVTEGRTAIAKLRQSTTGSAIQRLLEKPDVKRIIVETYEIRRTL